MIRFIIANKYRHYGDEGTHYFDLTLDIPELEKVLRSGGRNENGDYARYSLKLAYIVDEDGTAKNPVQAGEDYVNGILEMLDNQEARELLGINENNDKEK